MSSIFFCISYYSGTLDILNYVDKDNYIIYDKSVEGLKFYDKNIVRSKNVGYNIDSYFSYIIDNYDNLPEIIIFCKNNIYPRHISQDFFKNSIKKNTFTPLHDIDNFKNINFPVSFITNDNSYLELNNSWYANNYISKYFNNYNSFYNYIFENTITPLYLNFSPGANYIVPKNNILNRSKLFYINLKFLISHSQFSCESHFVERSLIVIWNTNVKESENMKKLITDDSLCLTNKNLKFILKLKKIYNRLIIIILRFFNKLYSS